MPAELTKRNGNVGNPFFWDRDNDMDHSAILR